MESNFDKSEDIKVFNIPAIAFRAFVNIAEKNLINQNLVQSLCYLLGPRQQTNQEEVWIDTVVLPMQVCSILSLDDNGIDEKNTMSHLKEIYFI